ncbi:hypothetical protein AB4P97_05820 [Pseudomonas sp. A1230]|uniref:hypothetical protein n=1 Tax=Pseudomonas sp. A1230 TaxID=3235106 RepID=UPI0037842279
MRSNTKPAKKLFKIPTHYLASGYLLTVLILALGISLSLYLNDWMWLGRFGAFLVCLALMFEVTGLPEKFVNKAVEMAEEITIETVFHQMMKHNYLYGISPETTDEQLAVIFDREHRRRLILTSDLMINTIKQKIQKHEFFVASVGTILWAFADLLNKV